MTDMVPTVLNGRFELVIPDHRAARPEWLPENGGWEAARMNAMHDSIGDGDLVYYIGAEEGEFPALCSMWGADVVLLEPNPKVWSNIKAIWDANRLPTPICFPGFASNVTNKLGAEVERAWPAAAFDTIEAAHGFKELHLEADSYPQITIDDLYRELGLAPTHMSFDVEGSEFQVLRGAEKVIDDFHPTIFASIHPEMMALYWGEWSRDLRNWLIERGYTETLLDYQHEVHAVYR